MKRCALAFLDEPISRSRVAEVETALTDLFAQLTMARVPVAASATGKQALDPILARLDADEADLAVVPARTLPRILPAGVHIAAVIQRGDPRYRLVGHGPRGLSTLIPGSSVVCLDVPARAQVLHLRPDLDVRLIEGPPDEIVRGVRSGIWTAAILPPGTLERALPWGLQVQPIHGTRIQPQTGSGLTLLLARPGRSPREKQAGALDHLPSRSAFTAERAMLEELPFDRSVIAEAFAWSDGATVHLDAFASDRDGRRWSQVAAEGEVKDAVAVGVAAARLLTARVASSVMGSPSALRRASGL
jgi:hydroxymethylbilane synthase